MFFCVSPGVLPLFRIGRRFELLADRLNVVPGRFELLHGIATLHFHALAFDPVIESADGATVTVPARPAKAPLEDKVRYLEYAAIDFEAESRDLGRRDGSCGLLIGLVSRLKLLAGHPIGGQFRSPWQPQERV